MHAVARRIIWAEPIMFCMPILCLRFDVCPYGMDITLWVTHFLKLLITFTLSTAADTWSDKLAALFAQTSSRVLFFVNVKAVLNTVMIAARWKPPSAFKVTQKSGAAAVKAATGFAPQHALAEGIELPPLSEVRAACFVWLQRQGGKASATLRNAD